MNESFFVTTMWGVSFTLVDEDVDRILDVPLGGWDHYVKFEWPP